MNKSKIKNKNNQKWYINNIKNSWLGRQSNELIHLIILNEWFLRHCLIYMMLFKQNLVVA